MARVFPGWYSWVVLKSPDQHDLFANLPANSAPGPQLRLHASLHYEEFYLALAWLSAEKNRPLMSACVRVRNENCVEWILRQGRKEQSKISATSEPAIRARFNELAELHPVTSANFEAVAIGWSDSSYRPEPHPCPPLPPQQLPWDWLTGQMRRIVREFQGNDLLDYGSPWLTREQERREAELARLRQNQEIAARQTRERELKRAAREERRMAESQARLASVAPASASPPLPPVPVHFDFPQIELQETALPLAGLGRFRLQELAALWWVSNQTDSLLCLPYCRIERLEYQVRTALRVLGPLRGRALLSDEVGLGKTIEAALVLKELLTRGMVKRFLVLTVPSLVDQWEEELNDKFGLSVATTNRGYGSAGAERFWEDNPAIVASLHTLKQPAQLEVARRVKWDMLIVDEAHYLRNRDSQAWQAVNTLPRQFLLLLTATPVQNSLEELLQPCHSAPTRAVASTKRVPQTFRRSQGSTPAQRTRRIAPPAGPGDDSQYPLQRWPQVAASPGRDGLVRAGVRARAISGRAGRRSSGGVWLALNPNQASLWGRLLLQAAGSSPAAWRKALEKFPDRAAAHSWLAELAAGRKLDAEMPTAVAADESRRRRGDFFTVPRNASGNRRAPAPLRHPGFRH